MCKVELKKGTIIECQDCFEVVTIAEGQENRDILIEKNICVDCLESNYFKCTECGEYHEEGDKIEVEFLNEYKDVCQDCVEWHDDKYFYCDDCGNYKSLEDYTQEEVYDVDKQEDIYMCNDCLDSDEYIFYCEYHERYERADDTVYINNYGETGDICWRAYDEGEFSYCNDCEEYYHINDLDYGEDEYLYCSECIGEHQGQIKSYHDHKMEYIHNSKIMELDLNPLTFGIELEVEAGNYTTCMEMSNILHDNMNDFTVYERDGSLNDGFEIITNPFDLKFYKHEGKDLLINMLDLLKENKFKSHDTSSCGYHIHVGRQGLGDSYHNRINNIKKINIVTEFFAPQLTTLSRRTADRLNHWAKFSSADIDREDLTLERLELIHQNNKGRYSALNLNNESTIEFRIFRGTLKHETFLATFELIYNLCSYCIENDITDLKELDFYTIATYKLNEYIPNYLESKGIKQNIKELSY